MYRVVIVYHIMYFVLPEDKLKNNKFVKYKQLCLMYKYTFLLTALLYCQSIHIFVL